MGIQTGRFYRDCRVIGLLGGQPSLIFQLKGYLDHFKGGTPTGAKGSCERTCACAALYALIKFGSRHSPALSGPSTEPIYAVVSFTEPDIQGILQHF